MGKAYELHIDSASAYKADVLCNGQESLWVQVFTPEEQCQSLSERERNQCLSRITRSPKKKRPFAVDEEWVENDVR